MVWRHDQAEPFGNNPPDENPSGLGTFEFPLRDKGTYADAETGLHYNYFRDYDPSLGTYKQSDLIGLRGGLNTYAYGYSKPLRFVDPDGLEGVGDGVGFFEGGGVGFGGALPSPVGIGLGGAFGIEARKCCGPDKRVYAEALIVARGGPSLGGSGRASPSSNLNIVRVGALPRCTAETKFEVGPTSVDLQVMGGSVQSDLNTVYVGAVVGGGASAVVNVVNFTWPWFKTPTHEKCECPAN